MIPPKVEGWLARSGAGRATLNEQAQDEAEDRPPRDEPGGVVGVVGRCGPDLIVKNLSGRVPLRGGLSHYPGGQASSLPPRICTCK